MRLSQGFRFVPGFVQVEAEGGYPERLLNEITGQQIAVWGVRHRQERTRFCCFARDYRRLRRPARRACVRMRVRRKRGLPFVLHRYRRHKGLVLGAVLYVVLLALLAPRIWVVQVVGNTSTPAAAILEQAQQSGVCLGARMRAVDIKRLEIVGLSRLPTLSWITVNPSGCVARVEVNERQPTPRVLDLSEPSAMVAVRDGRILSMTVLSGERAVMTGEAVSAGTVLITGRVQSEMGEKLYRAYGEVIAETQRQITVSVPLVYARAETAPGTVLQPTLHFLGRDFPLFSAGQPAGEYRRQERAHFLTANGLTLPLGITNVYYVPVQRVRTARTQQQAAALAQQQLAARQQALFAEGTYTPTAQRESVQNGLYTLTVEYTCRENIAVEVPLSAIPAPDAAEQQ